MKVQQIIDVLSAFDPTLEVEFHIPHRDGSISVTPRATVQVGCTYHDAACTSLASRHVTVSVDVMIEE